MKYISKVTDTLTRAFLSNLPDTYVSMEARKRFNQASKGIIPEHISQRAVSLAEWQNAIDLAKNRHTLSRWQLYRVYDGVTLDLHLTSSIDDRVLMLQGTKIRMIDPSGKEDLMAKKLLEAQWYSDYNRYAFESELYGFSLVEMYEQLPDAQSIKLNGGKYSYRPLALVELIPRNHVRPEEGKWLVNTFDPIGTGVPYTEGAAANYYLPIGNKTNLGMLAKIAPVSLAKRYAMGAWSEYDEKMGIPFRWVKMQGTNNKREKLLGDILKNMGSAGWAILQEGEEINLMQSAQGDPHKCFLELLEFCDKQVSKAVLGSTMTKDDGSSLSQASVHGKVTEIRHMADKTFITYLNNRDLLPRLVKLGYPLQGYTYEVDSKEDLSLKDMISIDTVLLQHYSIDPKYISDKYGIPLNMIEGKSPENVQDVVTEESKKKDKTKTPPQKGEDKGGGLNQVRLLYTNACNHDHTGYSLPIMKVESIEQVIKDIYDGTITPEDLNEALVTFSYQEFVQGIESAFGKSFADISFNTPDELLMQQLRDNVFVFSGFKTYQELKDMSALLTDENGTLKSYSKFKKDALALHKEYDEQFLRVEYNNVVASSQMASRWLTYKSEGYNLQYQTAGDERVRQSHREVDNVIKPPDDVFWVTHYPPNGWGCRCDVVQVLEPATPGTPAVIDMPDMFKNNVGETGIIFPKSHPYYEASDSAKKSINAALKRIQKDGNA